MYECDLPDLSKSTKPTFTKTSFYLPSICKHDVSYKMLHPVKASANKTTSICLIYVYNISTTQCWYTYLIKKIYVRNYSLKFVEHEALKHPLTASSRSHLLSNW